MRIGYGVEEVRGPEAFSRLPNGQASDFGIREVSCLAALVCLW